MALIRVHWGEGACVISDDHPRAIHGLFLRWLVRTLSLDGTEALFRMKGAIMDEGPLWIKLPDTQDTRDLIAWCYSLEGIRVEETRKDESKLIREHGLEEGEGRHR